jgi:Dihydropteroate synthase and related enzymes
MLESISTPETRVILAVHPTRIIVGTDSAFMLETILNENLISEISHAGYLGRELQKAEIALLLGRSYSQDDSF